MQPSLRGVNVALGLKTPSNAGLIELPLMPEFEGERNRINFVCLPPSRLVAPAVEFAVMGATEGNGEFVTDPAAEGARLGEAQMVRVRRRAPAHQAGLPRDEFAVLLVAQAHDLAEGANPFGSRRGARDLGGARANARISCPCGIARLRGSAHGVDRFTTGKGREPRLEMRLDRLGIRRSERVLDG